MRILIIHAVKFWFKVREKAIERPEELHSTAREGKEENALVIFTAIEEGDSECPNELAAELLKDLENLVERVKPLSIILYPYAHLSNRLATPEDALNMLRIIEEGLSNRFKGLKVIRAPFGWYKSFELHCPGHPLSELSKEYSPKELCLRKGARHECVLDEAMPEVQELLIEGICDYLNTGYMKVKIPSKIKSLLKVFGLTPLKRSPGRYSLILSGRSIRMYEILDEISESILKSLGVNYETVRTCEHVRSWRDLRSLYGEIINHYGKSLLIKDLTLNSKDFVSPFMPLTATLLVLRGESIRDLLGTAGRLLKASLRIYKTLGLKELVLVNEGFPGIDLVSEVFRSSGWRYSVINYSSGREALRLLTRLNDEILIELSSLESSDFRGDQILGTNILGIYENLILSALAKAAGELEEGLTPQLPIWLAPIQVSILPVKEEHLSYARKAADELMKHGIRALVDERKVSLGRKIRDAGKEWIPYVAVVGDREIRAKVLNVRIRGEGRQTSLTLEDLAKLVKAQSPI